MTLTAQCRAVSVTPTPMNQTKSIKKIVVSEDHKKLIGAVLVGDANEYGQLLQLALNGIDLPSNPENLILPTNNGEDTGLGVDALPDSATDLLLL